MYPGSENHTTLLGAEVKSSRPGDLVQDGEEPRPGVGEWLGADFKGSFGSILEVRGNPGGSIPSWSQ